MLTLKAILLLHFSKINFIATLVPTNVNNLRCRALNPTQVNIEWQPPTQTNGVIQFYNIILNNINTTQNTTKYVESNTTTTIINHLHPNHHYSCSIAVYSAAGRNVSAIQNVVLEGSSKGLPGVATRLSTSIALKIQDNNIVIVKAKHTDVYIVDVISYPYQPCVYFLALLSLLTMFFYIKMFFCTFIRSNGCS